MLKTFHMPICKYVGFLFQLATNTSKRLKMIGNEIRDRQIDHVVTTVSLKHL